RGFHVTGVQTCALPIYDISVSDPVSIDEIPADDFYQEIYDETDSVIVRPGQRVRHKKFGKGVVERVETGSTPTVVARFPGYGPKIGRASCREQSRAGRA